MQYPIFKNHAIATFCTTAKDFPLTLWDKLLPQIELCLNHLHPYKPNPAVSAYAGIHGGAHDFRAHPIAPTGSNVFIHEKPTVRGSWAPHDTQVYALGPALHHYCCYHVWATATNSPRVTDTVAWFLDNSKMPISSFHDLLPTAIYDLKTALSHATTSYPSLLHSNQLHQTPTTIGQLTDVAGVYDTSIPHVTDSDQLPPIHDAI